MSELRPKKVRIMGREYTIVFTDDLDALGTCDWTECSIEIQEGQHEVEEADTVLHEILHAIHALMNIGLRPKLEEDVVRKTATGLIQVFMDNPHLLTYIANAGPAPKKHKTT